MIRHPSWQVAMPVAVILGIVTAVLVHRYGRIGGDGPNAWGAVGLITMLPGVVFAEALYGGDSWTVWVAGAVWAALEWFLVVWALAAISQRQIVRSIAEPSAAANRHKSPASNPGSGAGGG